MRQRWLQNVGKVYYKMRQFYYKMWHSLQNATILLQNVTLAYASIETTILEESTFCFAISLILIICTYYKYVSPVEVFEKS